MRFFKLFFSRFVVVALAFILQVLLLVGTAFYFRDRYIAVQIVSFVVGLLAFCHLVYRPQPPEFKLAWMFLLLFLPLFGTVLYILFANPRVRPKQAKKLLQLREKTREYTRESRENRHNAEEAIGDGRGVSAYLTNLTGLPPTQGNRVTYLACGEEFFSDLKAALNAAQHFIFMEYFLISPGRMWDELHEILTRKAAEGVEVRILYDDIGTVGKLRGNYFKTLRREGIRACKFNPFRPILSGVFNNRDHRKITVVDGLVAYTGGINIGDEYINLTHPFGHWKDTAVRIEGPAVNHLCVLFLQMYDGSVGERSDWGEYLLSEPPVYEEGGYVQPFGDSPRPIDNERIGENTFLNMIGVAKDHIYLTTPYLIPDYSMITALRNAAVRGVDVRIITPHIPDKKSVFRMTRSNYATLREVGVKIYEYTPGFLHAKLLCVDGRMAFVGTVNFDYRSLVHHYECGAVLFDTPCIPKIEEDFLRTQSVSQEMEKGTYPERLLHSFSGVILNLFSPML